MEFATAVSGRGGAWAAATPDTVPITATKAKKTVNERRLYIAISLRFKFMSDIWMHND
jgi:hypothetical protein